MKYWRWISWLVCSALLCTYLGWTLLQRADKSLFLAGTTSDGHHQIELACDGCHTSAFGGSGLLQTACEGCHLEELTSIRDSHPRRKFTDPANAARVAVLDARECVTCHREHQEDLTGTMGVTVPDDVCFLCHETVGEERASHAGLPFDGCASSGCHNFHDNTALYEDFLVQNAGQPWLKPSPVIAPLTALAAARAGEVAISLTVADSDAPATISAAPELLAAWSASAHARSGINCSDCHQAGTDSTAAFVAQPDQQAVCGSCHEPAQTGFRAGKHGMRLAAGLGPMTPALARLPMHTAAAQQAVNCAACHDPHAVERSVAAVEACLGCHDSDHSNAFTVSAHGQLHQRQQNGELAEAESVTCATCHMPRLTHKTGGVAVTRVEHNQNANLRPSDKMLRSVCLNCHSLEFAIDALADQSLVNNNFSGRPALHVPSIDMALQRRSAAAAKKR